MENMLKANAQGKDIGDKWDYKGCEVVQIFMYHDHLIRYIQFQHINPNGDFVESSGHGRSTGPNFVAVKLDYPYEYLTRVTVTTSMMGLHSMTFFTNLGRQYGPFGDPDDIVGRNKFSYIMEAENPFGGFYGTADDDAVTSIGVYVKQVDVEASNKNKSKEASCKVLI